MSCKIGLVSIPCDNMLDIFVNLGEVFDKTFREDVSKLYELHVNLRYICSFIAVVDGNTVIPYNIEEITTLQTRYKLTRKIWISGAPKKKKIKFRAPQLYDISCMVPLFVDTIPRTVYIKGTELPIFMFILFPCTDPVIRGELVDTCMNVAGTNRACFYTLGGKHGKNIENMCDLSKRYLLSCGVEDDDIYGNTYDEFPDCILESLNMIGFSMPDAVMKVFIAVQREDMGQTLGYIRLSKRLEIIDKNIRLLCN